MYTLFLQVFLQVSFSGLSLKSVEQQISLGALVFFLSILGILLSGCGLNGLDSTSDF